jgi:hypothetical protein
MKYFVLVGICVAFFSAKTRAQILFEVSVNPSASTVTITSTVNAPTESSVNVPVLSLDTGITLLNFFPANSTVPHLPTTNTASTGTILPALEGNRLRVLSTSLLINPENLTHFDVFASGSLSGTATAPEDFYGNPSNPGKNLNLYSPGSFFELFSFSFADQLTLTFPTGSLSEQQSGGPYLVYAGKNNVYTSNVSPHLKEDTSFLGTYTLTVVPEPSTYAAIAGGLGLAAAVIHRRRQRAKAAQG